jgi:hypothetical protein
MSTASPKSFLWVNCLLLTLIISVRVYAAYWTDIIRTWDDNDYRTAVLHEAPNIAASQVLSILLLPQTQSLAGIRTRGYHSWLLPAYVLSRTETFKDIFGEIDPERIWQTVNVFFFLSQGMLVFLFAHWSLGVASVAISFTGIWLASPIVFGLNRWLMTENHVLNGLLLFAFLPCWYLSRPSQEKPNWKQYAALSAISLLFGLFSSIREYALPSFFLGASIFVLCLLRRNRVQEVFLFVTPLAIYCVGVFSYLTECVSHIVTSSREGQYYHPLLDWLVHAFLYAIGPGLIIWLVLTPLLILPARPAKYCSVVRNWRPTFNSLMKKIRSLSDLKIILASQVFLFCLYLSLGVIWCSHRTMRPSILLMVTAVTGVLLIMRMNRAALAQRRLALEVGSFLILLSTLVIWGYQLIFSFSGGRNYYHSATDMEYYNHPLYLPTPHADNMHVHPPA